LIQSALIECAHDWGRRDPDLAIEAGQLIEDLHEQGLSVGGTMGNLARARPLEAIQLLDDPRLSPHLDHCYNSLVQSLRADSIAELLALSPLPSARKDEIRAAHRNQSTEPDPNVIRELIDSLRSR
jgi:hypothetical protein